MSEKYREGDIVYVTLAGQDYLARNRSQEFNISVYGRLAKILEIYDWESERGKGILEERKKHFTWSKLKSEDFKYVLLIFAPELLAPDDKSKKGIAFPELFAEFHPMQEKKVPMFRKWDPILLRTAFEGCADFELKEK